MKKALLIAVFFMAQNILASENKPLSFGSCNLEKIFTGPSSQTTCEAKLIERIPNEQDKIEARRILKPGRLPEDMTVTMNGAYFRAEANGKVLVESIWISVKNPAILWYNGEFLTSQSNDTSVARIVDNLLRKRTAKVSRWSKFFQSAAYATDPAQTTGRDALVLYTIGNLPLTQSFSGASDKVSAGKALSAISPFGPLPMPSPWGEHNVNKFQCEDDKIKTAIFDKRTPSVADQNAVLFNMNSADIRVSDFIKDKLIASSVPKAYAQMIIEPKSPTEFIVTGLADHQKLLFSYTNGVVSTSARVAKVSIATCDSADCQKVTPIGDMHSWKPETSAYWDADQEKAQQEILEHQKTVAADFNRAVKALGMEKSIPHISESSGEIPDLMGYDLPGLGPAVTKLHEMLDQYDTQHPGKLNHPVNWPYVRKTDQGAQLRQFNPPGENG
jgi:hypothetical protein